MTLQKQLERALIIWPGGSNQLFLPVDIQDRLITGLQVTTEFNRMFPRATEIERSRCVERICLSARKLFAILLGRGKGEAIMDFLADGITDSDLPLVKYPPEDVTEYTLRARRQIETPIRAVEAWTFRDFLYFYGEQWWFKAPVFDTLGKHHELEDDCVLPFVEDKGIKDKESNIKNINAGGYSDVWGVRIHPAHQKVFKSTNRKVSAPCLPFRHFLVGADINLVSSAFNCSEATPFHFEGGLR